MATRGNEFFFASDQTILCGIVGVESLLNSKRLALKIPFPIESLSINLTGTMLAIIGQKRLMACTLPSPGFLSEPEVTVSVKFWEVGAAYATDIYKVIWNPMSRYDSELVVLTDDYHVRSYDLMSNHDTPDLDIELQQQDDGAGMAGVVNLEETFDPVSICFGKAETHGKLTLYVMSREGDVYALCPFVPRSFILTQNELEEMFDSAVAAEFEYRHSEDSTIPVRRHYKQQLDWISDLWKQMSMTIIESRATQFGAPLESYLVLNRPKTKTTPQIQGPFSLDPYPEEFYSTSGVDIDSLDFGVTVFCLTFENGAVLLAAGIQDVDLNWSDNVELNLGLAVVESITLGGKKLGVYVEGQDLHVLSETSIFRIDVSPWAKPISETLTDGDLGSFQRIMNTAPQSSVVCLAKPNVAAFRAFGVFYDNLGRLHTVTVTQQTWVEKWETEVPSKVKAKEPEKPVEKASYVGKPLDVARALANIALHPPIEGTTAHMTMDWETLTTLNKLGEFYAGELAKLHRIGLSMNGRLADQRTELHWQLKKTAALPARLDKLSENDSSARATTTVKRQEALQQRIDTLRTQLSERGIVLLSDQERKWADELGRLKATMTGPQGLEARVKTAVAQSRVLVNENKLRKINEERGGEVSRPGERGIPGLETETSIRLRQALSREGELVSQTKATLEDLLKSMEKLSC